MSVTKNYESTVISLAEESFLARFSDTRVLAIPGEMLGAKWAGRVVHSPNGGIRLAQEMCRSCGLNAPPGRIYIM